MINNHQGSGSFLFLLALSTVAALGGFLFGFDTAVISGTIPIVKQTFSFNTHEEGWFVSSALLGCITGVLFAGYLSDRLGRKKTLLIAAGLFMISAIGCMMALLEWQLISSRFIGGIGVGIASMISPIYIAEFAPARYRGSMVTLYQFAITIGILMAYLSNAFLLNLANDQNQFKPDTLLSWIIYNELWRGMFGMEVFPAGIFFMLLLLVPESPRWLILKGYTNKATHYLTKILGEKEANRAREEIEKSGEKKEPSFRALLQPNLKIPLLIGIALPLLGQFCGINAIIYYGPRILNEAGFTLSDSLGGQVTIGIVNVLFTVIAIWKIDQFGRKPLLLWGLLGLFLSLITTGFLFYWQITSGGWILFSILFFIACYALSLGPVQWVIISEIFPNYIRGRAMSIATLSVWGGTFIIGQMVPWLLENIHQPATFWLFGTICLPGFILVGKIIPETKNKSLEEIEQHWENN